MKKLCRVKTCVCGSPAWFMSCDSYMIADRNGVKAFILIGLTQLCLTLYASDKFAGNTFKETCTPGYRLSGQYNRHAQQVAKGFCHIFG